MIIILTIKVAGFPYTAVAAPVVSDAYAGYPYAYYGKREAEVILIKTITIMVIHIINHHCCCCQCHHNHIPASIHRPYDIDRVKREAKM